MPEWRLSNTAVDSIEAQLAFHSLRSPKVARSLSAELERTFALLAEFPEGGRRVPGTPLRNHVTRKYRYRIIYQITDTGILVRDVLHPARR